MTWKPHCNKTNCPDCMAQIREAIAKAAPQPSGYIKNLDRRHQEYLQWQNRQTMKGDK